jgi:hypothetical protein
VRERKEGVEGGREGEQGEGGSVKLEGGGTHTKTLKLVAREGIEETPLKGGTPTSVGGGYSLYAFTN